MDGGCACVRYMNGAATNPDAHAMAYAAAQTKTVMEVTQKLGTYVNPEAGRQAKQYERRGEVAGRGTVRSVGVLAKSQASCCHHDETCMRPLACGLGVCVRRWREPGVLGRPRGLPEVRRGRRKQLCISR